MKMKSLFDASMKTYQKEVDAKACEHLYLIYAEITNWLVTDGYGSITLSAIGHRFSKKVRINAVKEIKMLQM